MITRISGPIDIRVANKLFGYTGPIQQSLVLRATNISQDSVFHDWMRHKLTDQSDRITEVRPGDGLIYEAFNYLSEPCWVACHSRVGAELHIPVQRSQDRFAFCHTEFEEHTQHIMPLTDQYAFQGANHFNPEEVMKVAEIIHFKRCRKLGFDATYFIQVGAGDDKIIHMDNYVDRYDPTLSDEK